MDAAESLPRATSSVANKAPGWVRPAAFWLLVGLIGFAPLALGPEGAVSSLIYRILGISDFRPIEKLARKP